MMEYQIKDKNNIVIGRFQSKEDRDRAFKNHITYGFKCEEKNI